MKNAGWPGDLLQQLDKNLERVYVMEQRGFTTLRLDPPGETPPDARVYADAVNGYNQAFDDHQAFEKFYSADISHRTRANALVLDQKYDALKERFVVLKPILLAVKNV